MWFTYENLSDNAKICMWNASYTELAYYVVILFSKNKISRENNMHRESLKDTVAFLAFIYLKSQ